MRRVYMDSNATTQLAPEVFTAMQPYFTEQFGNASSVHFHGQRARGAVEQAREHLSSLFHCRSSEIVFTSGGTEGDNLALFGLVKPGDHLITSSIEHHAVLHAAHCLRDRGVDVTFLPVSDQGVVSPGDVRAAIRPETTMISIMMANNETGALQPVAEIGQIAKEASAAKKVWFHTDAVQTAGKASLDVTAIGCDLATISGHKMHAPQGVGALYVRTGTKLKPLFYGGSHERQRRAGTENLPGIVALGRAAELALAALAAGTPDKLAHLRDRLEQQMLAHVDSCGVNGGSVPRVPNTTNLWFDGVDAESLLIALDLRGLAVSGGSACSSGASEPSHVLSAMNIPSARAKASLRFSIDKYTTDADIDFALEVVPQAVHRLRDLAARDRQQHASQHKSAPASIAMGR
jgi:cysteine desulfurase